MKLKSMLLMVLLFLTAVISVSAQTDEITVLTKIDEDMAGADIVWDEEGDALLLISYRAADRITVSDPEFRQTITAPNKEFTFCSASRSSMIAVVSADGRMAALFRTETPGKVLKIEPDFQILSLSLSEDGTWLAVDSADEIRTVIYETDNGQPVYDLTGFGTAAPVYDSVLSSDGNYLLWHARGTFALQAVADGTFGETISLWDFASSYDLSPDNRVLAVGIINDDYENGAVIFFDPQTGKELGRTVLGTAAPYSLSYSADGKTVMAADRDAIYRIDPETFEITARQTLADPNSDEDRITRAALSPDGEQIAVLKSSGEIILTGAPVKPDEVR